MFSAISAEFYQNPEDVSQPLFSHPAAERQPLPWDTYRSKDKSIVEMRPAMGAALRGSSTASWKEKKKNPDGEVRE